MHVGISAWRLQGQRLGIGRYIEALLKYWACCVQPDDTVTVFVHEPFDASAAGDPEAGDDLVENEDGARAVAEFTDRFKESGGRRE